jgi:hypothetical protein
VAGVEFPLVWKRGRDRVLLEEVSASLRVAGLAIFGLVSKGWLPGGVL